MELTQLLQKADTFAPKTYWPFSLVEGGLPQGGIIEISGAAGGGKLEALLRFLAENPALQVAWVEEGATTYPCAFPQAGVDLERVLFVNAEPAHPEQQSFLMDCAHQILRSQIFGVLVLLPRDPMSAQLLYPPHHTPSRGSSSFKAALSGPESRAQSEVELRRLQIAAEKSGTTVFIIRETPLVANTWPLTAQLGVERVSPSLGDFRGELRVKLLKYRSQRRERVLFEGASSQALA